MAKTRPWNQGNQPMVEELPFWLTLQYRQPLCNNFNIIPSLKKFKVSNKVFTFTSDIPPTRCPLSAETAISLEVFQMMCWASQTAHASNGSKFRTKRCLKKKTGCCEIFLGKLWHGNTKSWNATYCQILSFTPQINQVLLSSNMLFPYQDSWYSSLTLGCLSLNTGQATPYCQ